MRTDWKTWAESWNRGPDIRDYGVWALTVEELEDCEQFPDVVDHHASVLGSWLRCQLRQVEEPATRDVLLQRLEDLEDALVTFADFVSEAAQARGRRQVLDTWAAMKRARIDCECHRGARLRPPPEVPKRTRQGQPIGPDGGGVRSYRLETNQLDLETARDYFRELRVWLNEVDPDRAATPTSGGSPHRRETKQQVVTERILNVYDNDPDGALRKTAEDWAGETGCVRSTVTRSRGWKYLKQIKGENDEASRERLRRSQQEWADDPAQRAAEGEFD